MIQAVAVSVISLALTIMMPAALIGPGEPKDTHVVTLIVEDAIEDSRQLVELYTGTKTVSIPVEEYLVGVVLAEMPASFEMEALKAQAVAARTFALRSMEQGKHTGYDLCADSSCCQAWCDNAAAQHKLGRFYEAYVEKVGEAVARTQGQVMLYEGELIEAVYFSCSGGATEDAVAVWGSDVPYLLSVKSNGEEQASPYASSVTVSAEEFASAIRREAPEAVFSQNKSTWIGEAVRTKGGGVEAIEIAGQTLTGVQIRNLFGLNSTNFRVEQGKESIVFHVLGYGHRVGMSQYGANAMAQEGEDYRSILEHYYTGISIKKK